MNMHSTKPVPFAEREFRDVLGHFATGVAVVTTCHEGSAPIGMAVNSFASVSLDPPEILWSVSSSAPSRDAFALHGAFAVNIMSEHDKDRIMQFARPSDDKFRGIEWQPGWRGVPVLSHAIATLECETKQMIPCGDHEIVVGSVRAIERRDGDPLLFFRGQFSTLGGAV